MPEQGSNPQTGAGQRRPDHVDPGGDIADAPVQQAMEPKTSFWSRYAKELIGGTFGVIVAAIGAVAVIWSNAGDGDLKEPDVAFESVEPRGSGDEFGATDGYVASGTVDGLPAGDSVWLLDKDESEYTIAQQAEISDGDWRAESYPVGDPTTVLPFTFEAAVIWASPDCANRLREMVAQDEYDVVSLPAGCREISTRKVTVTKK